MAQVEVKVPDIGDFKDVAVIEVMVKVGETIAVDTGLVMVESDKASMEIPSTHAGVVKDILVKVNDKVSEGSVILLVEAAAGAAAVAPAAAPAAPAKAAAPAAPAAVPIPGAATYGGKADVECEVLVLGAGPGGYSAAFRSADLGMKTVLVERYATLGGVCLNVGCIPSKALLHTASVMDEVKHLPDHGIKYGAPEIDLDKLRGFKDGVIKKLTGGLAGMAKARKVEVLTGASAHGQGHETAFSQIVADQLGVPFEDVEILHGDTQITHKGLDTYGSRSLVVGGIAIVKAAEKVIEKAKPIAAHLLEANADDLDFTGGKFTVKGTDKGVTIQEVALATFAAHNYPEGIEPSIDADATFDPENFSYPHGTHLCAVEIDTETGKVHVRKYVCVDDIGKVVNPLIAEGQVHGGLAQGIAQALWEEARHDESGTLTTATFVDYTLPTAADMPHFTTDMTESPSTSNPLGVKGVGEAGTIASTPAVINAVVDALRPWGVDDIDMPTTSQRVWKAIQGKEFDASVGAKDTRDGSHEATPGNGAPLWSGNGGAA